MICPQCGCGPMYESLDLDRAIFRCPCGAAFVCQLERLIVCPQCGGRVVPGEFGRMKCSVCEVEYTQNRTLYGP